MSTVQTDFANLTYMSEGCQSAIRSNELGGNSTCLQLEHTSQALNNYYHYLAHWAELNFVEKDITTQRKRPPGVALWHENTKVTGQWINVVNDTGSLKEHSRVVDNVSLAMPHPSVSRPNLLRRSGRDYSLHASVPSLVTRVLCANILEAELRPIVFSMWGNKVFNATVWDGISNKNDTAVDEIYGWTKRDPTLMDYPPVFPKLPGPSQTILNSRNDGSERDSIYLLAQGGSPSGSDLTGLYVLCQMRVTVTTSCSTKYNATDSTASLDTHCEDPTDDMMPIKTDPGATDKNVPSWLDIGFDWANSLSLNSGIDDSYEIASGILTKLILEPSRRDGDGGNMDPNEIPSVAEALAVMSGSTLLRSMEDAPLDTSWVRIFFLLSLL